MTLRWAMYGKDVAEELNPTQFWRLSEQFKNLNKSARVDLDCRIIYGQFTPEFFKYLYENVGKDYKWWYFLQKSDSELQEYLNLQYCSLLLHNGNPAGFHMVEKMSNVSTVLSYFGLTPYGLSLKRKGLGTRFLQHAVYHGYEIAGSNDNAWMSLYTTHRDHVAALPTYKKVGFKLRESNEEQEYIPLWTGEGNYFNGVEK